MMMVMLMIMMMMVMMVVVMMMIMMIDHDDDDDGDDDDYCRYCDDHASHVDLHIESPPTWHFKNTQPFRNSGFKQSEKKH